MATECPLCRSYGETICTCKPEPQKCPHCGGKGRIRTIFNYRPRTYTCPVCEGSGRDWQGVN